MKSNSNSKLIFFFLDLIFSKSYIILFFLISFITIIALKQNLKNKCYYNGDIQYYEDLAKINSKSFFSYLNNEANEYTKSVNGTIKFNGPSYIFKLIKKSETCDKELVRNFFKKIILDYSELILKTLENDFNTLNNYRAEKDNFAKNKGVETQLKIDHYKFLKKNLDKLFVIRVNDFNALPVSQILIYEILIFIILLFAFTIFNFSKFLKLIKIKTKFNSIVIR